MKYIKIYESFWEDYRTKSTELETEYSGKIEKALISLLDKLESIVSKENNGIIEIGETYLVYGGDPNEYELHGSITSIYIDPDGVKVTPHFEKSNGIWYLIEHDITTKLTDLTTFDKTLYIDVILKNASELLNRDIILKLNK